MSVWKSLFSPKSTPAPTPPADVPEDKAVDDGAPVEEAKPVTTAKPVTEAKVEDVVADADAPDLRPKDKDGAKHGAPTVAEKANRRGNFAAILAAQKAGAEPVDSPASIATLTTGKAFGARQAATVERIMGHPVTKEGLEAMYGSLLPDANVFVTGVSQDRMGNLEFTVNWMDNEGELVAKLSRRMARHDDGDLELYSHGCWVEPSHRSRAVSAAVMQREIELLENLSDHPRTRLSLWAGGMKDPKNPRDFQPLGVYVWATMGFDCAQSHGNRSRLSRSGMKLRNDIEAKNKDLHRTPDFDLMKHSFDVWVDNACERGELPDDAEILGDIKQAAGMCKNMWSLATLQIPNLKVDVDVGGRKSSCNVGKAFLLSEEAPRWEGVFYVNAKPKTFREVSDAYCGPRVEKATAAFEALQSDLAEALDGDDHDAKLDALTQVGRSGDARWVGALERILDEIPDLADAAKAALDRVTGKRLTAALADKAKNSDRTVKERLSALDLCLAREPNRRIPLLTALVEAPETGSDFEVARSAMNRLARGRMGADKLLGLLEGLYDRALNAREVPDNADFGGRGRNMSFFGHKTTTREAVVGHMAKVPGDEATAALLRIAKNDPYWEVAGQALDAYVTRVADTEPGKALAETKDLLDRARTRHRELKAEIDNGDRDTRKGRDLMHRISKVRTDAARTLGKLSGPDVVQTLLDTMRAEPYWDAVGAALESLVDVNGDDDPAMVAKEAEHWFRQASNSGRMRESIVDILERLGGPEADKAIVAVSARENDRYVLRRLDRMLRDNGAPGAGDARARVSERLDAIHAEEQRRMEQQRGRR